MSDAYTQTGVDDNSDQCSICLSEKDRADPKNTTVTDCGHMFCTSCLLKNLAIRNTCPICRAEIEPARAPAIEPLNATVVSNIIQEEETTIDVARRIAVIGAFSANEGRNGMILSLIREVAFGAGHSMAAWQGTDETTYHASWNEFEYTQPPEDDDEEEEYDDEEEEDEEDDNNHDHDDANIGEPCATDTINAAIVARQQQVQTVRASFQSPAFVMSPQTAAPCEPIAAIAAVSVSPPTTYAYSKWDTLVRIAIIVFAVYMKIL